MLTSKEIVGVRDILNSLTVEDLLSITDTVTKRMIVVENRDEAIEAILSYTEKPSDLLRRQKITKKVLFNYLRRIKVSVSPSAGKADFVKVCLETWDSKETYKASDYNNEQILEFEAKGNPHSNKQTDVQQSHDYCTETVIQTMGIEFSKWFFNGLNQLLEFGPQHFWPDCKLWAEIKTLNNAKNTCAIIGSDNVAEFFINLIARDKFFFHPNNSREAIECQGEQHGLIKISVSGVLHKFSNCIGLFDSTFGLVRNPVHDDNWKIKSIQLMMHINSNINTEIIDNTYGGALN